MSDDYCDSKGIKHFTKAGAESANRGYLNEERRARDKAAEAAREARHQRELLEGMARNEEEHRTEMRQMEERRLTAQERQNRFERDLLYLEKEHPAGRKLYAIRRVLEEMERGRAYLDPRVPEILPEGPDVSEAVRRHMKLRLPFHEGELSKLRDLSSRRTECVVRAQALIKDWEKLVLEKQASDSAQGGIGCGLLLIIIAGIACWFAASAYIETSTGNSIGSITGIIVFGLLLVTGAIIVASSVRKQLAISQRCGGGAGKMLRRCHALLTEAKQRIRQLADAEKDCGSMLIRTLASESEEAIMLELSSNHLSSRWYRDQFRERLEGFQNDFPKTVRVDINEVTEEDLAQPYEACLQEWVKKSLSQHVGSISIAVEKNGCWLSETDDHRPLITWVSVVLKSCANRKLAVIKALRNLNPELGVSEAKALVECSPETVLNGLLQEEALVAIKLLQAAGAEVELEDPPHDEPASLEHLRTEFEKSKARVRRLAG